MKLLWLTLLALYIPCPGAALESTPGTRAEDSLKTYQLQDTIIVVANRFESTLKQLTYTREVIGYSRILELSKHSSLEVVDVVFPSAFTLDKKIIGYGVGPAGGGSINIRGQGGRPNTGLLVLINGHPDFMGIFGHPLPDVYGIDDVTQVEILAGPSSTVFGSQAMGGVVNITTRPNYLSPVRLSIEAGSHTTYSGGLHLAGSTGKTGLFLSGRYNHTDGHIPQTGFTSLHVQAGAEHTFDETWRLSLTARYVPFEFDDPARGESDQAGLGTYGKIRRGTGEVILENRGSLFQGSTQVYGNWGHHRFYDGFESRDFTLGLSSYQQWKLYKQFNVAFGGDLTRYGGKAENRLVPPGIVDVDDHSLSSVGLYALGVYTGIPDLTIKVGLRYQYSSLPLNNLAPVVGLAYSILPGLRLYGNYQYGFRYPTLNELYLFPPSNPDLQNEQVHSLELGIWYNWAARNSLRLSFYQNDITNIILQVSNPSPPPPLRYANSGSAAQRGIETQIHYYLLFNLALRVSYSYLDTDNLTAFNPRQQLKYMLVYSIGMAQATLVGKYIEELFAENNARSPLPDYNLLNLILSVTVQQWTISLKFQNLLDRRYYVLPDYPAPGFILLGGVRWGL
jgi:iron complex outermembrane receptor protein